MDIIEVLNWAVVLFLGVVLGSFATAIAYRIPRGISIFHDSDSGKLLKVSRSACVYCHTQLTARDLVPVLSWVTSKGRCRHCGGKVSVRYPLIELATMIGVAGLYASWGYSYALAPLMFVVPILVALFVIDMDHFILPNALNLMAGLCGIAFVLLLMVDPYSNEMTFDTGFVMTQLAGAALYFMFAAGLGMLMSFLLKKPALGGGDVKFFFVAGLWLGPAYLPFFLISSGVLGVVWAVIYSAIKEKGIFPFGPALILAFYTSLVLKGHSIVPFLTSDYNLLF